MKQRCRICQRIFDYCHSCAVTKNLFKNAGYCDENCYHISMILQKYKSGNATAEETIETLNVHNIESKELQVGIQRVLDSIVEKVVQQDVEVVIDNDKDVAISEDE